MLKNAYEKWLKITDETNSVWKAKKLKKQIINVSKKSRRIKIKKVPVIYLSANFCTA